mgnify:CR=1 FL=1
METRVPARLTRAEGRKFGLTVGAAFLLITAFLWWRGFRAPLPYLGGLGGGLVLAGALVPGMLGPVYKAWMGLALLLSKVTTPIFMGVVYFLVITPVALVMRLLGKRLLAAPSGGQTYWTERSSERPAPSQMKRQF